MHSREEIVRTEIRHEDAEEGQQHVDVDVERLAQPLERGVERSGIDEHRDESPHLLGVPAPVAAPAHVCPYGSDEDACGKETDGGVEEETGHGGKLLLLGKVAAAVCPDAFGGDERHEAEQSVGEHYHHHVDGEQGRLQYGHEQRNLRIAVGYHCHEQGER